MTSSLQKLVPDLTPVVLKVNGESVLFKKITVSQSPKFLEVVEDISEEVVSGNFDLLVRNHLPSLLTLISLATGVTESDIGTWDGEILDEAISSVYKANEDYFMQAVSRSAARKNLLAPA
jgi:hypothetical protein